MYRHVDGGTMVMPSELDKHIQAAVSHMINPCPCQDYWERKLAEAVDSQRLLQEQVHVLLRRFEQADMRCAKSKEEAALNAQALKRQVSETQRLAAECKSLTLDCEALTVECRRLEHECNLYHNDREVFMEVADEAEERAAQAEDRAIEANRRVDELLQELENIRECTSPVLHFSSEARLRYDLHLRSLQRLVEEDVPDLRSKLAEVEMQLQKYKDVVSSNSGIHTGNHVAFDLAGDQYPNPDILLGVANRRCEDTSMELRRIQETYLELEKTRDEKVVSSMVMSAISAGVVKALEQERDEAISSLNLQFKAILKRMQGEFRSSRERLLKKWTGGEGDRERLLKPWTQNEGGRGRCGSVALGGRRQDARSSDFKDQCF